MKKLMDSATLALSTTLGICLYAQQDWNLPNPPSPYWHDIPRDDIWEATFITPERFGDTDYVFALAWTTLGPLARYSDIIGVGQVSQRTNDHFVVTVDHALVGCTNGAAIKMHAGWDYYEGGATWEEIVPNGAWEATMLGHRKSFYFPTNQGRIVFAACTNYSTNVTLWEMFWDHAEVPKDPIYNMNFNGLRYINRSWWYTDRDDGVLLTQFTNVLQAVRFDRNWTNYLHLCRDGANSASNRVREDSFEDLRRLCGQATEEQKQFILDDPLIDQQHKDLLIETRPHLQGP
jgi:hypothetical protein